MSTDRTARTLTIADNGIGIDAQYEDRVFQIFQRLHTRDVYDGTGIGLVISKRIVEFHGGNISLGPSDPGACFRIYLPAVAPSITRPDLPPLQPASDLGANT